MSAEVRNKFDRLSVPLDMEGAPSLTKQSMKNECDINQIMRRYAKTGAVAHVNQHGGSYGFASAVSFHEAMSVVATAEQIFEGLPSKVRKRCGNDPAVFLAWVQDPANLEEVRKFGLAPPAKPDAEPAEPLAVRIVDEQPRGEDGRFEAARTPPRGTVGP